MGIRWTEIKTFYEHENVFNDTQSKATETTTAVYGRPIDATETHRRHTKLGNKTIIILINVSSCVNICTPIN